MTVNEKKLVETWVANTTNLTPNNTLVRVIDDCFVFGFDWLVAAETKETFQLIPDYYVSTPKENPRSWALAHIKQHSKDGHISPLSGHTEITSPAFLMGSSTNYFHFIFDVLPRLLVYTENIDPSIPLLTDDYIFANSNTFQLQ